jgi:hypothetical protein
MGQDEGREDFFQETLYCESVADNNILGNDSTIYTKSFRQDKSTTCYTAVCVATSIVIPLSHSVTEEEVREPRSSLATAGKEINNRGVQTYVNL